MIQEEALVWRDLYRAVFDRNVAGIILTKSDGRIVDCNEQCARIFGFASTKEMLAYSAWDLSCGRGLPACWDGCSDLGLDDAHYSQLCEGSAGDFAGHGDRHHCPEKGASKAAGS